MSTVIIGKLYNKSLLLVYNDYNLVSQIYISILINRSSTQYTIEDMMVVCKFAAECSAVNV